MAGKDKMHKMPNGKMMSDAEMKKKMAQKKKQMKKKGC